MYAWYTLSASYDCRIPDWFTRINDVLHCNQDLPGNLFGFQKAVFVGQLRQSYEAFLGGGGAFAIFKADFGQVQRIVKVFTNYIRVALRQYTNP